MSKLVPKFVVDTDAGVDDATALLMAIDAHKRGDINLLAITTVAGNTANNYVVKNVCRILEVANCKEIPVHSGSSEAMVVKYERDIYFHGVDGFNDVSFSNEPDLSPVREENAVDAIRRLAKQFPGEITLVTLGPLTNVALAFKVDTDLPGNLREMVVMGGNTDGIGNCAKMAEFNFHADPEAAYAVLDMCIKCPVTTVVAWELCFIHTIIDLDWSSEVLWKAKTPEAELISRIERPWMDRLRKFHPVSHFAHCDQLAMAVALDKRVILQSSKQLASVELFGSQTRGQMVMDRRRAVVMTEHFRPNVVVVEKADKELFKKYLLRSLGHPNIQIN